MWLILWLVGNDGRIIGMGSVFTRRQRDSDGGYRNVEDICQMPRRSHKLN